MDPKEILVTSLQDYFHELVHESLSLCEIHTTPATREYIVTLLCDNLAQPAAVADQPLGLLLIQSQQSDPAEYIVNLKTVGDRALYVAGFFRERLERRQINLDYYSEVGGTAYRRLRDVMGNATPDSPLTDVYGHLGAEFRLFVEALAEVKKNSSSTSDDIGALYEDWVRNKALGSRRRLERAGVLVTKKSHEEN